MTLTYPIMEELSGLESLEIHLMGRRHDDDAVLRERLVEMAGYMRRFLPALRVTAVQHRYSGSATGFGEL